MHLMMKFSHIGCPRISIHANHAGSLTVAKFSGIQNISKQHFHRFRIYMLFIGNGTFRPIQPKIFHTDGRQRSRKLFRPAFHSHFPEIPARFRLITVIPQHDPVAKISQAKSASHKMRQHMDHQIKCMPRCFVCVHLKALNVRKMTMVHAFRLHFRHILI